MVTFSLQSGSNGNAIYVEAGDTRLLFDAGITGAMAKRRMAVHKRCIEDVDAVILSHDHVDHVRHAGVYQRKFGLPIYMTKVTERAIWTKLGPLTDVRYFRSGDSLAFGSTTVYTIPTPHDAADGVAFVVEHEGSRLGILTDLGHPFAGLQQVLESVDGSFLESNYDPNMLRASDYPARLKARIRGGGGHLSNDEAAALTKACGRRHPKWIAVAHLSQDNNLPELAIEAQRAAIGGDYPVYLASRNETSHLLTV